MKVPFIKVVAVMAMVSATNAMPRWLEHLRRDYTPPAAYNPVYGAPAGGYSYTYGGYGPHPTQTSSLVPSSVSETLHVASSFGSTSSGMCVLSSIESF